jgi:two-component system LytT family sensor kinase
MKIQLPQYSGKDYLVLAITILPITLAINAIIFGSRYFTQAPVFLLATVITAVLFVIDFIICGFVAIGLKNRLPLDEQTNRRLFYMIVCFVLLTGFFLVSIFHVYELLPSLHYTFNEKGFIWAYVSMAIMNIFLTLVMEGIHRYNHWRDNLKETEQIKKNFIQSQLLGLKSQVNPHFLFNSLNTLSSLISENGDEAETFLNEMSKVYRYMLRSDDEQLVPLQTELKFIDSYAHLLDKRYGQSLQVHTSIHDVDREKLIPPLSLQVLIENAFTQNSMSKTEPLVITIYSEGNDEILVRNTRRPKAVGNAIDFEAGLDNLVVKYRLLNAGNVVIQDDEKQRSVSLPLLQNKGGYV